MLISEFNFDLPDELIAQNPLPARIDSRLMVLSGFNIADLMFPDFIRLLKPGDILVRNNTKVIPAKLFGGKTTSGRVEILIERILSSDSVIAMLKCSNLSKMGARIIVANNLIFEVLDRQDEFFILKNKIKNGPKADILALLKQHGHMPLPPYISRQDTPNDFVRYQTVYAKSHGAVAAPTAGLHFDEETLNEVKKAGVSIVDITLHVGAGTFRPVQVDDIENHKMHSEWMEITERACKKITNAKRAGGRIIVIGTTSLRALETAALSGKLRAFKGNTDIFITPGFNFNVADLLLTNFHLPKSTLLMLVSAFAGKRGIEVAYQHAIKQKYRFFSYGDVSLLERKTDEL